MGIDACCGNWSISWPYPRALFLGSYVLGFTTADIGECQRTTPVGVDTLVMFEMYYQYGQWHAVPIYNFGDPDDVDQIDAADFGDFYVVTTFGVDSDGDPILRGCIRDAAVDSMWGAVSPLPTVSAPKSISCCNFNGQCIIGGVSSTEETWKGLCLNTVGWSGIGSYEFRPDENKTAGFMPLPWAKPWGSEHRVHDRVRGYRGAIYRVAKLGNKVAVYADEGRAILVPYSQETASGFGLGRSVGGGIASGNHMAGDDNIHCFIDAYRDLWLIDSSMKETKLGYREYMDNLLDEIGPTIITYVPSRKRFYISNGVECYVLTEHGLYSTHQLVTSVGDYRGNGLFGFWKSSGDIKGRITTDTIDFGLRGFKTLSCTELGVNTNEVDQGIKISIHTRSNSKDAFTQSSWRLANKEGVSMVPHTAQEFRVSVQADSYSGLNLSYINNHVKVVDRRFVRGVYAMQKYAEGQRG
jgi:hypothetical protein